MIRRLCGGVLAFLAFAISSAAAGEAAPVSFQRDLAPLLQRRCVACHGEESAKGRYRLDTFARLLKSGDSELPPVVEGKPAESELARLLHEPGSEDRMPQKADPLPEAEIALIERWIAEGAKYDGGSTSRSLAELARSTMLRAAPEKYARPVPITALAMSPDETLLAVNGYYEVAIWRIADGALLTRIGGMPERITALAWHPTLPLIAAAGGTPMQWGTVVLADPTGIVATRYLCDMPDTALSVAFSPDGTRMAASGADRTIRYFNPLTGRARKTLKLHADWVQTVAFNGKGNHILSTSRDRTARVIEASSGEVVSSYTGHETALVGGIFSEEDRRAWTFARGGSFHRWKVDKGETVNGMSADIAMLLATPRGQVAIGGDGKIRRYEFEKLIDTWPAPAASPTSAILTPKRDRIAIGTASGEVVFVSLADGKETGKVRVVIQ